jgi:hypothetical protein
MNCYNYRVGKQFLNSILVTLSATNCSRIDACGAISRSVGHIPCIFLYVEIRAPRLTHIALTCLDFFWSRSTILALMLIGLSQQFSEAHFLEDYYGAVAPYLHQLQQGQSTP